MATTVVTYPSCFSFLPLVSSVCILNLSYGSIRESSLVIERTTCAIGEVTVSTLFFVGYNTVLLLVDGKKISRELCGLGVVLVFWSLLSASTSQTLAFSEIDRITVTVNSARPI